MIKKCYLFMGTLLLLLACGTAFYKNQNGKTIAASTISLNEQIEMEACWEYSESLQYQLLCNEKEIPYDAATDTYYLPQFAKGSWIKEDGFTLLDDKMDLFWCEDEYWDNLEKAIMEGHAFSFIVTDGVSAQKGKIVFTGLPMLNIQTLENLIEDGKESYHCSVEILDPSFKSEGKYKVEECYGYLTIRGRTSKAFPKKGWDLNLVKENRTPYKTMLFGMREDDNWKLNALYPDATKVRERICMELWNTISEETQSSFDTGSSMEYFELIIDNEYMGLYGAMEKIDYKQLSLKKNEDILYKSYAWPGERHPELYSPEQENYGHLIKTGGRIITEDLWNPLLEYVTAANFAEYGETCDVEGLYEYIKTHMDIDNFVAAELYVQALYAYDNKYKNFYIACDNQGDGSYTLWKVPWDLNYTFGDRFNVDAKAFTEYNLEWSQEIMPEFMLTETLLEAGNQEFAQILNEKWGKLKEGTFSLENVQRIAEENMELLISSGAFARDEMRWPDGPHDKSIESILEFHSCRLNFLDEHYRSYLNEM